MAADLRIPTARAFVRSLNILLKFSRLYGFDHPRTADQFKTAIADLRMAIATCGGTGLLLAAAGNELLLDGKPMGSTPAERGFGLLLASAGISSLLFTPLVTDDDVAKLARSFPSGTAKPAEVAAQLKKALADVTTIRMNEIRFVPENADGAEMRNAAQLIADSLGGSSDEMKSWLTDPQKLLQLIAAAQGNRSGAGPAAGMAGPGGGTGGARTNAAEQERSGVGAGSSDGTLSQFTNFAATGAGDAEISEADVLSVLKALTQMTRDLKGDAGDSAKEEARREISSLPPNAQDVLRDAIASFAAQTKGTRPSRAMLAELAEHLAIRFALERYSRGEVKVNAIRQLLEKMNREIASLRDMIGEREAKMAQAGIQIESRSELMDRRFWSQVPEAGKQSVLLSGEAWCIPGRNVRAYANELNARQDHELVGQVLGRYSACIHSPDAEARRRAAAGIAELADLYAGDPPLMVAAIRQVGMQLCSEGDPESQVLIDKAFTTLSHEAASRRCYPAIVQVLTSLEGMENQRPALSQTLLQSSGIRERMPDFLDEALRCERMPEGLADVLRLMPQPAIAQFATKFRRAGQRVMSDRLAEVARSLGAESCNRLKDTLRAGKPEEAVEVAGLLSRLDPAAVGKIICERLPEWPLAAQDRLLRVIAAAGAPELGALIAGAFTSFDPMLRSLAIEEIGMSGDLGLASQLFLIAEADGRSTLEDYMRLKAIEAIGRLRAPAGRELLQGFASDKRAWRRGWHDEIRIAAYQALEKIDPKWSKSEGPQLGFESWQLIQPALDPIPDAAWYRQRRYQRIRLDRPATAVATSDDAEIKLVIKNLSLGGGVGTSDRRLLPGTKVVLKIGTPLRSIRMDALMRDVRNLSFGFEILSIGLEDRSRLRKLLAQQSRSKAQLVPELVAAS
ncbi:MAG TPA: PilZ domain-containing protein [Candidatus Acidoferrales bacterium]|nr:PilZ domain-containing protein [Candidatus Acidoferrales bacterium]